MATQKIEIDLSKIGPFLKPYLPVMLNGLSLLHVGITTLGVALQKLDKELRDGTDALPETKARGPMGVDPYSPSQFINPDTLD